MHRIQDHIPVLIILMLLNIFALFSNSCYYKSYSKKYDAFYAAYQDTVVTLERTMCYGPCPSYRLLVYGDGTVIYEGRIYVKKKKRIISHIPANDVKKIVDKFMEHDFFSLKSRYKDENSCAVWATDNSTVIISLKTNNKSDVIEHYFGCCTEIFVNSAPIHSKSFNQLCELENYIDDMVNICQWTE